MTALRRRLSWGIAAMVMAAATLALLYRAPRKEGAFFVPSAREARAAQARFEELLADPVRSRAADALPPGLVAARMTEPQGVILTEPQGECQGRGDYLLRGAAASWLAAITAPHRGADRDTGPLAQLLFSEHPFAAAAWNSAPRGSGDDCAQSGDIARLPTHYLTAFSLAFAARHRGGRVVQLHGFDPDKRTTQAGQEAAAILSDGTASPAPRLLDLADCLSRVFPDRQIAVYGIDSDELGATSNAQGKALRQAGFSGFAHLELSADFRRTLLADPQARAKLARCLGAAT